MNKQDREKIEARLNEHRKKGFDDFMAHPMTRMAVSMRGIYGGGMSKEDDECRRIGIGIDHAGD
jgi:hypothetical protein